MDMVDFIDEEDLEFYPDPDFVSVSQGEDDQSS